MQRVLRSGVAPLNTLVLPSKETKVPETPAALVDRAFGATNRARLFAQYFEQSGAPTPENAWLHVYRLLLWIDRTTGLAHCYESDKSQPGRHWYGRSLAFHAWLADELNVPPANAGAQLDWLFRKAIEDVVKVAGVVKASRNSAAAIQRAKFEGKNMPEPGEDPELGVLIKKALRKYLNAEPTAEEWRHLTQEIFAHFALENKRRNLVGEGFEDLLAEIIRRVPSKTKLEVGTRVPIESIPGFTAPAASDKEKKIDLVVQRPRQPRRILTTVKWSIRADREEQFASDFAAYVKLERAGEIFDYVLVTNEFDPARLVAACERSAQNSHLFRHVVHINPAGLKAAYGSAPKKSAAKAVEHIANGRLISLANWLKQLASK